MEPLHWTLLLGAGALLSWAVFRKKDSLEVTKVTSGDSLEVIHNGKNLRIKLEHIEAPAIDSELGIRARQELRFLLLNNKNNLKLVESKNSDSSGQPLYDLKLKNADPSISQIMVRNGWAGVIKESSNRRLSHPISLKLAEAEELARKEGIGIWASEPANQPIEIAPVTQLQIPTEPELDTIPLYEVETDIQVLSESIPHYEVRQEEEITLPVKAVTVKKNFNRNQSNRRKLVNGYGMDEDYLLAVANQLEYIPEMLAFKITEDYKTSLATSFKTCPNKEIGSRVTAVKTNLVEVMMEKYNTDGEFIDEKAVKQLIYSLKKGK